MEHLAEGAGYRTIFIESHEGKPLSVLLVPHLRRLLFALDRMAGAGNKARRALGVLKGFLGVIKVTWSDFKVGLDTSY
jgi:hypothetical protein